MYSFLLCFHTCLLLFYFLCTPNGKSQEEKAINATTIQWTGYADVYYAYYTDSVGKDNFQKFPTVSPRTRQFGLNVAMLSARYDAQKVRATASVHFGDIARSSWSSTFNNILEANAGFRLFENFWIDAGFFRTHVGAESLYPKENIASSLALVTFHEPYYQAGLKLNYQPENNLTINFFLLNGYNQFEDNNNKKSLGMLLTYAVNEQLNFGYNNYLGDDTPAEADSLEHLRFYNNIFFNYQISKFKFQSGLDYAMQQNGDTSGQKQASMVSALLSTKYSFTEKVSMCIRGEVFNDEHGFISGTITDAQGKTSGLELWGITAGFEIIPAKSTYLRLEARQIYSGKEQQIFNWEGWNQNHRFELMTHFGISF